MSPYISPVSPYISPTSPLYLPYISQARREKDLHLPYISPTSPLYLPCISPVSPLYLRYISPKACAAVMQLHAAGEAEAIPEVVRTLSL